MSLLLTHTRYQFTATVRVPMALIGAAVFPALSMVFFVATNSSVAGDPLAATAAVGQLAVFSVMTNCLFSYGVGISEDRAPPWEPYLRTLPAGVWPRLAARLLTGLLFTMIALLPLVVAAVFTAATVTPVRLAAAVGALLVAGLPFLFGGVAIGYLMPVKAALPVVQVLFLPLAFGGGLFIPPQFFPSWLDTLSTALPSRGGRDLVVWALTAAPPSPTALLTLAGWSVLAAVVAGWAYRRDEGQRFR